VIIHTKYTGWHQHDFNVHAQAGATGPPGSVEGDRWTAHGADGADIAERNIDALLLHPNRSDVELRLRRGGFCPAAWGLCFDSFFSQAGEVFARLGSTSEQALSITIPRAIKRDGYPFDESFCPAWQNVSVLNKTSKQHDTHWVLGDACACGTAGAVTVALPGAPSAPPGCVTAVVQPHQTTPWLDIGALLPTLDHSTLNVVAGNYTLQLGVKEADGTIVKLGPQRNAWPPPALTCKANPKTDPYSISKYDISGMGACANNQILVGASIRSSRQTKDMEDDFRTLYRRMKNTTVHGRPPTEVAVFAFSFPRDWAHSHEHGGALGTQVVDTSATGWDTAVTDYNRILGLSSLEDGEWHPITTKFRYGCGPNRTTLQSCFDTPALPDEVARVFVLGDEIKLMRPEFCVGVTAEHSCFTKYSNTSMVDEHFHSWLVMNGVTAAQAGCASFAPQSCAYDASPDKSKINPALFFHSARFADFFGVFESSFFNLTSQLRALQKSTGRQPNTHTCANFPPGVVFKFPGLNRTRLRSWLPLVNLWVSGMRQGLFTLPFSEDYVFQSSCGSQQMFDLSVDVSRASVRPLGNLSAGGSPLSARTAPLHRLPGTATVPGRAMMQYVMSYFPGNTVDSQRRRFFGSLAHGVKWFHLYSFNSYATSGGDPGPDVTAEPGMYEGIRLETNALGMFDDIIAAGANGPQGAKAAMLFSATADIWLEGYGTSGAAKRSLYIAVRHAGIALDVVVEEDLLSEGRAAVAQYAVVYIADRRITTAAGTALTAWVNDGGTVLSALGGAMTNETNQPNLPVLRLLGIASAELDDSDDFIEYIKQVRKTRSWPRSWANFSRSQLHSHRSSWANLHILGQPNTFSAPGSALFASRRQCESGC
jgi:hypothetical protein